MISEPIICFGQQPCGFFPKRFLVAKINTARQLQKEMGGKIIFFYHDSDADYRETITIMRDRSSGAEVRLNFTQENKIQKKFSPLYLKRIPDGWKEEILKQLPRFIDSSLFPLPEGEGGLHRPGEGVDNLIDIFSLTEEKTAADFCLQMYQKLGLLDGIEVIRSSDKKFRESATDLAEDFFVDIEYQSEVVRAQLIDGKLQLHEGGGKYLTLPDINAKKSQKSAGRDQRFAWMQSVLHCTHYIYGAGEGEYLEFEKFPEVKFIEREKIEDPSFAWIG